MLTGSGSEDAAVLVEMLDTAADGIAILDRDRQCVRLNRAGARILGISPERAGNLVIASPLDRLHWDEWPFTVQGQTYVAVVFREADRWDRQQAKLAAFARTAARMALLGPLDDVLDRVAAEARDATGALACSIILRDRNGFDEHLLGVAGHDHGYAQALLEGLAVDAPLAALEAMRTGRPARRSHLHQLILDDQRYGRLADSVRAGGWTDLVAVPLAVQEENVGVLTCMFGGGQSPSEDDVTFLLAMADQTGVAVHNTRLFAEVQAAAAAEQRHRWVHDLHDSISQTLFSFSLQTRAALLAVERTGAHDGEVARALHRLAALAADMRVEMRTLMTQLEPDPDGEQLTGSLRRLGADVAGQTGLLVDIDVPEEEVGTDSFTASEVYRVVREAVHNAVHHAAARRITISLQTTTGEGLAVDVVDDGRGFDTTTGQPGHLGLWSMRERVERLGGEFRLTSSPTGTRVGVVVPFRTRPGEGS